VNRWWVTTGNRVMWDEKGVKIERREKLKEKIYMVVHGLPCKIVP
jgi:hypothetical protein